MNKYERKKHASRACGITPCEWCLVWGFPCTIMLVVSTLAALRIGTQLDGSPSIELCVFTISFTLLVMVYYTVFQYMITSIGCMFKVSVTLPKPFCKYGHAVEGAVTLESKDCKVSLASLASKETAEPMQPEESVQPMQTIEKVTHEQCVIRKEAKIPVLSSEAYTQRNEEYMAELEAERSRVLAAIIEYVHYTMSCFMKEEDMPSFCQEIVKWADDPYYAPKSANLKVKLSTIELRHFIWNIGERLGRENGYDGYARALFAMSLFPLEFTGIEIDTVKNFTVEPRKGRIKLDRPDPDSYEFHYPRKILP